MQCYMRPPFHRLFPFTRACRRLHPAMAFTQKLVTHLVNKTQVTLRAHMETLPLLTELRSEALKDRHWRPLLRRLGIRVSYQELNLGFLWGSALLSHRKAIGETVLSAQGEMALEEFLRQARLCSPSIYCFVVHVKRPVVRQCSNMYTDHAIFFVMLTNATPL